MKASDMMVTIAAMNPHTSPIVLDEGYAARRGTRSKGSGTGKTRHKVSKSRAKAKAARKARRIQRG